MKKLTVGVEVVPSVAFGRSFVEGVSRYAIEQKNWRLVALQQGKLSADAFKRLDGAILRIFDDRTETAAACGYASPQYFCRVFKTHFGNTPSSARLLKMRPVASPRPA